jgi:phosphate transport system substrate-binding protein
MIPPPNTKATRRTVLAGGAALLGSLAGCSAFGGPSTPDTRSGTPTDAARTDATTDTGTTETDPDPLRIHASTPWPWIERAVGLWNANPDPGGDELLWQRLGFRPDFDARVADHFASQVGLSLTGERTNPPFRIAVGTSSAVDISAAMIDGRVDLWAPEIAQNEANVPTNRIDDVREYVYGYTGSRFVVSTEISEAGVRSLTLDELAAVYEGKVTNWRALGGPDREIFVTATPNGTPPTRFELFLYENDIIGRGIDVRFGQTQEIVKSLTFDDRGIGVVRADIGDPADVEGVAPLALRIDGRRYGFFDPGYPMTETKPLWTLGEPDPRERVVIRLLRSSFGQRLIGRLMLPAFPGRIDR